MGVAAACERRRMRFAERFLSYTEGARMPPAAYAEIVHLEKAAVDATDPQALGRFWETALATETLTDEPDRFETRLTVPGGPVIDLCQRSTLRGLRVVRPARC